MATGKLRREGERRGESGERGREGGGSTEANCLQTWTIIVCTQNVMHGASTLVSVQYTYYLGKCVDGIAIWCMGVFIDALGQQATL